MDNQDSNYWMRAAPWMLSVLCVMALAIITGFLYVNLEWFKDEASRFVSGSQMSLEYRIHIYHMHVSMVKRSVGLISGFALMFLGLCVAFYTLKSTSDVGMDSPLWSLKIATSSPGIVAMVVGSVIVSYTIGSKDVFPAFVESSGLFEKPNIKQPAIDKRFLDSADVAVDSLKSK